MESSGTKPRAMLPIRRVGTYTLNDRGGPHLEGWQFGTTSIELGAEIDLDPTPLGLAGWTHAELHRIAHGNPCDCPIGQVLGDDR